MGRIHAMGLPWNNPGGNTEHTSTQIFWKSATQQIGNLRYDGFTMTRDSKVQAPKAKVRLRKAVNEVGSS